MCVFVKTYQLRQLASRKKFQQSFKIVRNKTSEIFKFSRLFGYYKYACIKKKLKMYQAKYFCLKKFLH